MVRAEIRRDRRPSQKILFLVPKPAATGKRLSHPFSLSREPCLTSSLPSLYSEDTLRLSPSQPLILSDCTSHEIEMFTATRLPPEPKEIRQSFRHSYTAVHTRPARYQRYDTILLIRMISAIDVCPKLRFHSLVECFVVWIGEECVRKLRVKACIMIEDTSWWWLEMLA